MVTNLVPNYVQRYLTEAEELETECSNVRTGADELLVSSRGFLEKET